MFAALAAGVLASCNEQIELEPAIAGKPVELEISVDSGAMTKATNETGEKTVNSLQVFVFGKDNKLEAYKDSTGVSSIKMGIFSGTKIIHALVNAPALSGIVTYKDFYTATSKLTDNNLSNFVMEGRDTVVVGTGKTTVPLKVGRVVSKVSLVKVENKLADMYENLELRVTGAYLINVAGNRTFSAAGDGIPATPAPTLWFNKMKYDGTGNVAELTYESIGNVKIDTTPYKGPHHFYCYPNPTKNDSSESTQWSDRYTRLVIEVTLGGTAYCYPINLPDLKPNMEYKVSLCITRPGSGSPDTPYDKESATVSVEVLEWGDGGDINEII